MEYVEFEWDPRKARQNLTKHGIDFADAAVALTDELALTIPDPDQDQEERFIALCRDPLGRVLTVVFTWRGERVRLISARKATRTECGKYEASQ
jgi:uncharacterized protein